MARALAWDPQFAKLSPALADRKLCEYTRVLQLTSLEQRAYAKIDAKRAAPEPVGLWKKHLSWLTVAVLACFPMSVPQPPARRRPPPPPASIIVLPPHRFLGIIRRARTLTR